MQQVTNKRTVLLLGAFAFFSWAGFAPLDANAAEVESDGGITLFVSYDSSQAEEQGKFDAVVCETPGGENEASNCDSTNTARGPGLESPGSCSAAELGDGEPCTGRQKLEGDLIQLARHIYQSTHGAHHLKKVYVADQGRLWGMADVLWDVGSGPSFVASTQGNTWKNPRAQIALRNASRTCIHDVLHHELGHYLYGLPERYVETQRNRGCKINDAGEVEKFDVEIATGDPNSVMNSNFPHDFVDSTNALLTVKVPPGAADELELKSDTPEPKRANWPEDGDCEEPFGLDEWAMIRKMHTDLQKDGVHEPGHYPVPDFNEMKAGTPQICFLASGEEAPGMLLLLDRSMGQATRKVQQAALYLYHSASDGENVGAFLYDDDVTPLYAYGPRNEQAAQAGFSILDATTSSPGADLPTALEHAIDTLQAAHTGACGPAGSAIVLMSNRKQSAGADVVTQVERAAELGIGIHTLMFGGLGAQSDEQTMHFIAESSFGTTALVSNVEHEETLKLDMVRAINRLRGYSQLRKIPWPSKASLPSSISGEFTVEYGARDLLLYVFVSDGDATALSIERTFPAEDSVPLEEKFTELAEGGGFIGVHRTSVAGGPWTFVVQNTDSLPLNTQLEAIALVRDAQLISLAYMKPSEKEASYETLADGEVRKVAKQYTTLPTVEGTVQYRYPLILTQGYPHDRGGAVARVYDGPRLLGTFKMTDVQKRVPSTKKADGDKPSPPPTKGPGGAPCDPKKKSYEKGGCIPAEKLPLHKRILIDKPSEEEDSDEGQNDGVYNMPPEFAEMVKHLKKKWGPKSRKKLRVEIEFIVTRDSFPADLAYEPGTEIAKLAADYADLITKNGEAGFSVYATTLMQINPTKTKPPALMTKKHAAKPGGRGKLVVQIRNARPLQRQLRVFMGPGVSTQVMEVRSARNRHLSAEVVIAYQVAPSAKPGKRDLSLQFGDTILRRPDAFQVIQAGRPPSTRTKDNQKAREE